MVLGDIPNPFVEMHSLVPILCQGDLGLARYDRIFFTRWIAESCAGDVDPELSFATVAGE